MADIALSMNHIAYSYHSLKGETKALEDITFQVNKGEFLAIVGPSGCGKSTLLSLLAGLLSPEAGTIDFPYHDNTHKEHPPIGYMLQHDQLFEWRSIYKNVTLGLEINHKLTEDHLSYANKLLTDYELYPFKNSKPSELSGGMRQRAALIRTMVLKPEILLLDEPFSALDYQTRLSVSADICRIIRASGVTAILITHDLSEAISLADRVLILSRRPATIKMEVPIQLTLLDDSPLAARNAPEFNEYFNLLWEVLSHDETK